MGFRVAIVDVLKARASDFDRKAAEYVLSIGGAIRVNGEKRDIKVAADLPAAPFRLTNVLLHSNFQITDAGLAIFKDCKNVTDLGLSGTQVSALGLGNFKNCKNLEDLHLYAASISEAGLAHFKDAKNLQRLNLGGTTVNAAGIALFKDCPNLVGLYLSSSKQVSDDCLVHCKEWKKLETLHVPGTQVSDAGLLHLKECKNLKSLELKDTKVTAAGVADLKKALPQCNIESDYGSIPPAAKSDNELILGMWRGVSVEMNGQKMPQTILDMMKPTLTITAEKVTSKAEGDGAKEFLSIAVKSGLLTKDAATVAEKGGEGIYHLDSAKSPKTIDIVTLGGARKTALGIYTLDGDTLKLCLSIDPDKVAERPKEFSTKEGEMRVIVTFKRQTDPPAKKP